MAAEQEPNVSEHVLRTVGDLEKTLKSKVDEVRQIKRMINDLCRMASLPLRYAVEEESDGMGQLGSIKPDSFYGRPLATVIREYLQMRRGSGQSAATVNEIHEALKLGGYEFETKDEDNAKRGLRASLSKNPIFHQLPNGQYGLSEWYPKAKKKQQEEAQNEGSSKSEKPPEAKKSADKEKAKKDEAEDKD